MHFICNMHFLPFQNWDNVEQASYICDGIGLIFLSDFLSTIGFLVSKLN